MKDDRVFVDTNIFIYASLEGNHQGGKRDKAIALLQSLSDKVVLSILRSFMRFTVSCCDMG